MKTLLLATCAVALLGIPDVTATERKATFAIQNMTCALCPLTVEKAMRAVDGVQDVAIDFAAKTASVSFDDLKASPEAIEDASTNAGYPATLTK